MLKESINMSVEKMLYYFSRSVYFTFTMSNNIQESFILSNMLDYRAIQPYGMFVLPCLSMYILL